ncbi:recombinase family protein [Burkholderia ubonensis]|uniref:recombinase family protein n=1 Tax=Burkholderia ubonensis TaxID=101571 RepID=UPI0009B453B0|nr:recombinase family protein [Burkholderia ubonensis]
MKKIGYARVSTEDQSLDLQMKALVDARCDLLFSDHGMSGISRSRPGLTAALEALSEGDIFVVWRLDRLGRSLSHMVTLIEQLGRRSIEFVSLTEHIDTRSSGGVLMFHMMAALAQFERSLISERTRAGLAAAKERGSRLGRPSAMTPEQQEQARNRLVFESVETVARIYGIHPRTLRRLLVRECSKK